MVSTMRLVDSPEEQLRLEAILDAAKPPLPKAAEGLHFLLAAPFRYRPRPPGSRFRGPEDPGVFYGAVETRTACAEVAWWRWRGFLLEATALAELPPVTFTIFPVAVRDRAIDLREPPFAADRATWTDPADYAGTQVLARVAREADLGLLLYESVRDPKHAANVAVLAPRAFGPFNATRGQTWTLLVTRSRATWIRRDAVTFSFETRIWQ